MIDTEITEQTINVIEPVQNLRLNDAEIEE